MKWFTRKVTKNNASRSFVQVAFFRTCYGICIRNIFIHNLTSCWITFQYNRRTSEHLRHFKRSVTKQRTLLSKISWRKTCYVFRPSVFSWSVCNNSTNILKIQHSCSVRHQNNSEHTGLVCTASSGVCVQAVSATVRVAYSLTVQQMSLVKWSLHY